MPNLVKSHVGDVTSAARGQGARYNVGKVKLDLLPLYIVCQTIKPTTPLQEDTHRSFSDVASFQRTGEEHYLDAAISNLSNYWETCANVFEYGTRKYAEWNWVKGMAWSIPIGCIARHSFAIFRGEDNDPESGLPHIGHILCNLVMLKSYINGYPEGNDLPPKNFQIPLTTDDDK